MLSKLFKRNEFAKNTLTLMLGTVLAQAIPLLFMPILSRLYSPEDFGEFSFFMAIVGILSVIATARYEVTIMLPKKLNESYNLTILSILIASAYSILVLLVLLLFREYLEAYVSYPLAFLIPVFVFIIASFQSFRVWLNKNKEYKKLATNNVEASMSLSVSQMFLSFFGKSGLYLIVGALISQALVLLSLAVRSIKIKKENNIKVNKLVMQALFKRYFHMAKYGVPALLTSRVAQESLVVLVGNLMGNALLGFVTLLQRVISVPSSVISSNIGNVFYQKISTYKKNESYPLVLKFALILILISILVFPTYYFIVKNLFVFMFGNKWAGALDYAPYLFWVAGFSFVFSPLSSLFNYFEFQGWNWLWQSLWLTSNIIVFAGGNYIALKSNEIFLIYSISQSILYSVGVLGFIFYSRKICE